MSDAAQALARALIEERRAAVAADFDALLRVQEEKRARLSELQSAGANAVDAATQRELAEAARQNIYLIRHLFACVKGYLGATAEPGYTARGEVAPASLNHVRGRL
jgi:hypothetical protein